MTTTRIEKEPHSCEGRKCWRTATIYLTWPNTTDPDQPHHRYLCALHYDADYRGRAPGIDFDAQPIEVRRDA